MQNSDAYWARDLFDPGVLFGSNGIEDVAELNPFFLDFLQRSLQRHYAGDWGEPRYCVDHRKNHRALARGWGRLFSRYVEPGCPMIFIVTDEDWSATEVCLASEYRFR